VLKVQGEEQKIPPKPAVYESIKTVIFVLVQAVDQPADKV